MQFTEQPDQSTPTVFRTCWASCNNGVNVILQKYGKGEGRGGRTSLRQFGFYFDAGLFICFSVLFSLLVRFLLHLREQVQSGCNIVFHYLSVFAFVCSTYIYCTIISAPVEKNVKSRCNRPTPLLDDNKQ